VSTREESRNSPQKPATNQKMPTLLSKFKLYSPIQTEAPQSSWTIQLEKPETQEFEVVEAPSARRLKFSHSKSMSG